MEVRLLQPLCPSSCSPIQTVSDFPWRHCHKFDPNLHVIQPNSNHHSIHRNSSHHHIRICPCKNYQWDTSVQIPVFLKLSLVSGFRNWTHQFSRLETLVRTFGTFGTFGFCPHFPFFFQCPHSWTMTCSVCLCQTIACLCSCVHCSLIEHVLHPSRGLDDLPLRRMKEN